MKRIMRKKLTLSNKQELDTGNQILIMFVTPKLGKEGSDYEQQRAVYKAIKYLRGKGDDDTCGIEINKYIYLEDTWYEHLIFQAKNWPWGMNDPAIFDMIEEWINAEDAELKAVK